MNRQQQRLARAHVRGSFLWEVREHFPGANLLYAQLDGRQFSKSQATRVTQEIADVLRTTLELHRLPLTSKNPTLVHHGWIRQASWHVLEDPGGDAVPPPLADLYGMNEHTARKIAQALASGLHRQVILMDNTDLPARFDQHPMSEITPLARTQRRLNPSLRPKVGEIWHGLRGDRCRILSVTPNRVTVLQLDTGHRVTSEMNDFLASYKPPGRPQTNPKGLNFPKVPAESLKVGDVVMPPERELRLWMVRDAAKKGIAPADLGIMLTDVHEGEPDKRGRWIWFSGYLRDEWYQGRRQYPFKFKARPDTPWPVPSRPTQENPARSPGARARRKAVRSHRRSVGQGIGGRRVLRALSRGQRAKAQHIALQSKYRYHRRHAPVPTSNRRRTANPADHAWVTYSPLAFGVGGGPKFKIETTDPKYPAERYGTITEANHYTTRAGEPAGTHAMRFPWARTGPHYAKRPNRRLFRHIPIGRNPVPRGIDPRSIRTVRRGATRIRIGCPKGKYSPRARRCRVGTREFEKLKPRSRSRNNPRRGSEVARARRTSQMWHEFPASRVTRAKGDPKLKRRTLVKLGDLVKVDYRSNKYSGRMATYTHSFKRPRPILATDPDAQHLHIVSGKVKITADGLVN